YGSGSARLFATVGSFSDNVQAPDSFIVTTATPWPSSMANGDSAQLKFGLLNSPTGCLAGQRFREGNRHRTQHGVSQQRQHVYVPITSADGITVGGYGYTNNTGDYDIQVPANNPPGTASYNVSVLVPTGMFPTTPSTVGGILISAGQTDGNHNFGFAPYQIIT